MHPTYLEISNQRIAYYDSGTVGPAVVFVHGNSCAARTFAQQFESPLTEVYRVIALDLPGHGHSSPAHDPATGYTLPGFADVLVAFAEALSVQDAVFVGWSLGGHIVLEAVGQLTKARGFAIYGCPPVGIPAAFAEAYFPHPAVGYGFAEDVPDEAIAAYVRGMLRPQASQVSASFIEDFKRTDSKVRSGLAASVAAEAYADEREIVATLQKPLAVLHGAEEQLINRAYLEACLMPTLWQNKVHLIPNAGHAAHWENPDGFNAALLDFVEPILR